MWWLTLTLMGQRRKEQSAWSINFYWLQGVLIVVNLSFSLQKLKSDSMKRHVMDETRYNCPSV